MHIDSIQLFRVPLPAAASASAPGVTVEALLVGMSSQGQIGWGEVCLEAGPYEHAEWSAGAMACLRDWLAPALVGRAIRSGDELQTALAPFQGNARAKSALDMAWWNLTAALRSVPLFRLLGGPAGEVEVSPCLGMMESVEPFLAAIGAAFEAGAVALTLKFRPGWDVQMVRAVRQAFAAEPMAIDCDGLCTLGQQEMFFRLEDFNLLHIEQPLSADDLVGNAMLASSLRTPICLDQSVTSLDRVEQAIDLGSCGRVRIDVARVGGLTPALAIAAACAEASIACSVNLPQQALSACVSMALATLPAFSVPGETLRVEAMPAVVCSEGPRLIKNAAGRQAFSLPEISGPGVSVDLQALAGSAVDRVTIG
jgi:O-succinylbenzoate synthase